MHPMTAALPAMARPPGAAGVSAVAAAAADAASPKLWQKAAPTKSPRNVTAESEEP
ncbi:hypothetical protein LI003_23325 [Bacteroides caccae]|uniref:hypothetical protein n=1 Tax=Bacteroides caccae TaxID=47678 RepID=UPI001D0723C9|nr:hypothetical protein [Bacteroides caccae]MCB7372828.1 hypothetical protein [Bacteroides caccae]